MKIDLDHKQGFTLIEVMIALLIFAIMAVIATTGLSTVLKSRDLARSNAERLAKLQIAMVIMQNDFTQMINRRIINNKGALIPAIISQQNYAEFTRAGYLNPLMALQRSTLQRVAYEFNNNKLIRITWPVLDRAPDTKPMQRVLLKNVTHMQIRYLDTKNRFYTSWPPPQTTATQNKNQLPKAVEISINIAKWGSIQRIFVIPSGEM